MATQQGVRFILVECRYRWEPLIKQWRATGHPPEEDDAPVTDIFFFAENEAAAKDYIRARYSGCTFSDEHSAEDKAQ